MELAERPTASEPRRYDSFCNVAASATGLVTVSKTGDSDRAASRISCRVSSSASEATRKDNVTSRSPGRIGWRTR